MTDTYSRGDIEYTAAAGVGSQAVAVSRELDGRVLTSAEVG